MAGIDGIDVDWPSGLPIAFEALLEHGEVALGDAGVGPHEFDPTLTIFLFTGAPRAPRSARDTTGKGESDGRA